ncbi:hypothetical protein SUGI_0123670 [Cryptomeria japonica]|nr:hypothetical protein SUGI_0123670 [Cryptomeria japonica]
MVLKLSMEDEKSKKRALKAIARFEGVDSIAVDMTQKQITVEGDADPVCVTSKLRKFGYTELLSFGPAKDEKKESEDKKPKEKEKAEPEEKKPKEEKPEQLPPPLICYPATPIYYYHYDDVRDQYPNSCIIV